MKSLLGCYTVGVKIRETIGIEEICLITFTFCTINSWIQATTRRRLCGGGWSGQLMMVRCLTHDALAWMKVPVQLEGYESSRLKATETSALTNELVNPVPVGHGMDVG